jgi:hypothetical protein
MWREPEPRGDELRGLILEAAAWCEPRANLADPAGSLRQLPNPSLGAGILCGRPEWVVGELAESRRKALGSARAQATPGRLLAFLPDDDLADGAAEQITNGFFDVHNTPAWDTWVAQVTLGNDRTLIAYVPRSFVALAEDGIWVNPEVCILWLDEAAQGALGLA